jgi:hypothetical protein
LAWSSLASAADAQPVVPVGALAHAVNVFEANTGGKVLEIQLVAAPGVAAFEAAIVKGDGILYLVRRLAPP